MAISSPHGRTGSPARRASASRDHSVARILALVTIAACTTGSVLSLEPAVDVGCRRGHRARAGADVARSGGDDAAAQAVPRRLSAHRRPDRRNQDFMPDDEADCRRELKKLARRISRPRTDPRGRLRHRPSGPGLGHRQRQDEACRDADLRHGRSLRAMDAQRTRALRAPPLFLGRQDHPPGVELFLPQDRRQPRRPVRARQGQCARRHAHRAQQRQGHRRAQARPVRLPRSAAS